jgi:hypothetical protein
MSMDPCGCYARVDEGVPQTRPSDLSKTRTTWLLADPRFMWVDIGQTVNNSLSIVDKFSSLDFEVRLT